MWFIFALLGQLLLVGRRTTEKELSVTVNPSTMAWLQQFVALPFMIMLLPLAVFYNPFDLSDQFHRIMIIYTVLGALDLLLYFKALSVGDISIVAPIFALTSVSAVTGSYFILGQSPTLAGLAALALVVVGVVICSSKKKVSKTAVSNTLAIICAICSVCLRGIYGPMEVLPIRETNPIYFNFISSLYLIPTVLLVGYVINRFRASPKKAKLATIFSRHKLALMIVGATYAVGLTFNYTAKLIAPNAGYATTIRNASVLPMVIIGALFFKEHVSRRQWLGLGVILLGLALFPFA